MSTSDIERQAQNALLVSRMQTWAAFEDDVESIPDEEVGWRLPSLLSLIDAVPRRRRAPLRFPPIGGGPQKLAS